MKGVILLAALAAMSGCSTTVARPVEAESTASRVVIFGDLDLRNSADVRVLHNRIRRAAVQVCGGPVLPRDVAQFWIRQCIERSVTRAVADVNSIRVASG
jgi:UrcA family protein